MKYKVAIEETFCKTIEVEAESAGLAVCIVEDEYNEGNHKPSMDDFTGVDIALSTQDEEAKCAMNNPEFVDFVEYYFEKMGCEITLEDKIRNAFGSIDNALYEFREASGRHKGDEEKHVCMLYKCDAWHSYSSMEAIGAFSSQEKATEYLRRNQIRFRLKNEDLDQFEAFGQTQGRDENYICSQVSLDLLPEEEAPSVHDDAFYDQEFTYGDSKLSRRDLESLPEPFCTEDVTDEQMQEIITQTDVETRTRLKLDDEEHIDFENERHNEAWWEELEAAVNGQNVPYYEDLLDVYHGTPDPEVVFFTKGDQTIHFTDDRAEAEEYAYDEKNGGIGPNDLPVLIHARIHMKHPYLITDPQEWAELIANNEVDKKKYEGYDGPCFTDEETEVSYYILFDARNCKITEREILE